jgi:hypothetical protein
VLGAPFTGVGRIHADDGDAAAGGHRGEPGAKARGGDGGHGAAELFPPRAAAHGVAAGGAGIGEVEVLDDHRGAPGVGRAVEQGGDRRARRRPSRRLTGSPAVATGIVTGSFIRPHRSRCSTTTAVTLGSANSRHTLARAPIIGGPDLGFHPHHRHIRLGRPLTEPGHLPIQIRPLIMRGNPRIQSHTTDRPITAARIHSTIR